MNFEFNLIIVKQGEGSVSGLNEAGKLQAEEICNTLIEKGYKFDKIYSSNSNCAKQTLEPYLKIRPMLECGPYMTSKNRENVFYTEGLAERDHSTIDKSLLEGLSTGIYNPTPPLDFFYINLMNFDDENLVIDRVDRFVAAQILRHLIYPEDHHFKSRSFLIVTHSDYFNIISSMFIPSKFSKIETTNNILNINFNHDWQLIFDESYEVNLEYKLYTRLYEYVRELYLQKFHESPDQESDEDLYNLTLDRREFVSSYYRDGRITNFWD